MTTLTMHNIGMATAKKAALLTSHFQVPKLPTVPKLGIVMDLDIAKVVFEDEQGNQKTAMTKIRFNEKIKRWEQISPALAGMLVFFRADPPDTAKKMRIVQIVPNGRACYAEPA